MVPHQKINFSSLVLKTSCLLIFTLSGFFCHQGISMMHHKDLFGSPALAEIRQGSPLVLAVCDQSDFERLTVDMFSIWNEAEK